MHQTLLKIFACDKGAVTAEWVVLSAAIVLLGVSIIFSVKTGALDLTDNTMKIAPAGV